MEKLSFPGDLPKTRGNHPHLNRGKLWTLISQSYPKDLAKKLWAVLIDAFQQIKLHKLFSLGNVVR